MIVEIEFEFEFQIDPVDAEEEVQSGSRKQYSAVDEQVEVRCCRRASRGASQEIQSSVIFEFQTDPIDTEEEVHHNTRSILKQSRSIER